ncbi:MAG: Si-specific NAD(P)(+) transhydrogenase [Pseudomonadota bacterium]
MVAVPQARPEHFDLIVIGSGPSGRRGAIQAAKLGKRVMVVEKNLRVGGVSVHTGTIPSKTLRETVMNLSGWRERGFYGRAYRVKNNIGADDLKRRLDLTLNHEVEVLEHQFTRNSVTTQQGVATFTDAHTIEVTGHDGAVMQYTADHFLLSVGTRPHRPNDIPFDGHHVLDSDELLRIEALPRSLCVIGAGVIGIEYATIFSALDIPVTLIDPREEILDFIDREIISELVHQLRDRGVQLHLGAKADEVLGPDASGCCTVRLDNGRVVRTAAVLYAAGRTGATSNLGLEHCGLETDRRGRVTVDPQTFQTAQPHIYAVGDVIGFPSLASTSMEQGRLAACHAFDFQHGTPPQFFPYGIYAVPEISTCGLSEHEVREKKIPYEVGICRFRETSRGQIMGIRNGMMKMLFRLDDRSLLGVHIIGEGATELIHIGQAVVHFGGTVDYFVQSTFNYPTLAEAYKISALDAWNRMR